MVKIITEEMIKEYIEKHEEDGNKLRVEGDVSRNSSCFSLCTCSWLQTIY